MTLSVALFDSAESGSQRLASKNSSSRKGLSLAFYLGQTPVASSLS